MLRASVLLRGVSPFTLFLMDHKNNPELKGCAISKRGRILSKMYKELSQNQRRELKQRAARHPTLSKMTRQERESAARAAKGRHKGGFAEFVRDNYHKVRQLNYRKRFAALSQLYDVSKPLDVENEVAKVLRTKKSPVKANAELAKKAVAAGKAKVASSRTTKQNHIKSGKKKIKEIAKTVRRGAK
ncbi:kinetoplast-associated protein Tcp22 [Trypanosoma grayi]|uniref:kinetoplast-associated protein Tcp22 n=1 Tax=Trypanosoma grayi TaxID=71804 RepID=UPI0004F43EEE|nr:kinetoplast-associated protein Tcp22 [Trypanosoma grayi]KEG14663.1 kinetoplast-associated protein Tcp22 [Trypanosoma grayi]